jgi:hypothetical protein
MNFEAGTLGKEKILKIFVFGCIAKGRLLRVVVETQSPEKVG